MKGTPADAALLIDCVCVISLASLQSQVAPTASHIFIELLRLKKKKLHSCAAQNPHTKNTETSAVTESRHHL